MYAPLFPPLPNKCGHCIYVCVRAQVDAATKHEMDVLLQLVHHGAFIAQPDLCLAVAVGENVPYAVKLVHVNGNMSSNFRIDSAVQFVWPSRFKAPLPLASKVKVARETFAHKRSLVVPSFVPCMPWEWK